MCGDLIRFLAKHSPVHIVSANRQDTGELCKAMLMAVSFSWDEKFMFMTFSNLAQGFKKLSHSSGNSTNEEFVKRYFLFNA